MTRKSSATKYRRRLFYNFFVLFIAFSVAIGIFQFRREKEYRRKQVENKLITYNHLINKYYLKNQLQVSKNYHMMDSLLSIIPDPNVRITIIDSKGMVLYDSYVKDFEQLENHLHRPEVQQAILEGMGESIRFSSSTSEDFFYCVTSFDDYFVRTALPFDIKVMNYLKVDSVFIFLLLGIFLVAFFVLLYLSDRLGKSITQLQDFALKAGNDEVVDINEPFQGNELGIIGHQIVEVYNRLQTTKKELIAEREKLFRHLQISHEGIAVFAKDKSLLLANNHFIQYLNTLSDQTSVTPVQFFVIEELKPLVDFIDEQLTKRKIVADSSDLMSNILTINKNGKYYVIQTIVFHDLSFEISISDVTKLEKEKKLKQQMTSNIAHELKTPISSILGYLETILTTKVDREKRTFFIERALFQTQRLSDLIQDLSQLNKMEEASDLYEIEAVNIFDTVQLVIDDLTIKMEERKIQIDIDIAAGTKVIGNRSILYSIWRNLIENSVNYAGEGVQIHVRNYMEDARFYYFAISDNGVGIAEEHLGRIFDRFYRIDKGRSRSMGGTGLGLSIVKNGVLFHKGEISVKNLKGGGVEFVFSLAKDYYSVK